MTSPAIRVENLSKQYQIGARENGYTTFREALSGFATSPLRKFNALSGRIHEDESFWALKDVAFEVEPGEVLGIIGRNGAGKSTLLKILSQITEPTTGRIEITGRVASLLEVGTGFHPELTGRENIFLNGSILGMNRAEVRRQFDAIVAFAEVEKFIDTPVKRYSSGMTVRLGFAVAAHLQPEILFVDEVLAVGDAAFQKKCLGKMNDLGHEGRTVLFVSHNMGAVRQLTSECVVIGDGRVTYRGPSAQAVDRYLAQERSKTSTSSSVIDLPRVSWCGDRSVEFVAVELLSPSNRELKPGQDLEIGVSVRAREDVTSLRFGVTLFTNDGMPLSSAHGVPAGSIGATETRTFQLTMPDPGLAPGEYWFAFGVLRNSTLLMDAIHEVLHFEVLPDGRLPTGFTAWNPGWGCIRMSLATTSICTPRRS